MSQPPATMPGKNMRVGTASWSEPEFVKAGWYPKGLPVGARLSFYAASRPQRLRSGMAKA